MITNKTLKNIASSFLLLTLLMGKGNAAITDLATSPITITATGVSALPNIMFVLDDSGSMNWDYLPDWANPVLTFDYLYKNAAYNGVAYNAATYYTPPVMYTSSGSPDTTRYPIQNSANTSTWTAVKDDGYGVQSTFTSNLPTNAVFYTTIPGEYCDGPQLRNCSQVSAPTGTFTYPAKLRWCQTAAAARGTTASSNSGNCQAAQIGLTIANQNNGLSKYRFPRSPSYAPVATLTLDGAGVGVFSITSITAGYIPSTTTPAKILSVPVSTSVLNVTTTFRLKSTLDAIKSSINACTTTIAGSCNVTGYKAVSDNINTITILSPIANTNALTITAATSNVVNYTTTAFSQTPGSVVATVISNATTSYAYAGGTTKSPNRIDCAGTTCTYAEEMTNYANWWAYYHTRMQAMKTSVSTAFSTIDDQYRVGYFSINNGGVGNGSGNDYINVANFNAAQKYSWYTKFFQAYPSGETPLRIALSSAGQVFSGKLTTLNGATVTDPMQYSCQQNFTILSTDGYWNESATPTQIDKTTAIGQQDGVENRPYYDGSAQIQNSQYTTESTKQYGTQTAVTYKSTWQQTKTIERLDQKTVIRITHPFYVQERPLIKSNWKLQKRYTTLNRSTVQITKSTSTLNKTVYQPGETVTKLARQALTVKQALRALQETNYKLYKKVTAIKTNSSILQKNVVTYTIAGESTTETGYSPAPTCTPGVITNAAGSVTTLCAYQGYAASYSPAAGDTCSATNQNGYDDGTTTIPNGTNVNGPATRCQAGTVDSAQTTSNGDSTVSLISSGTCQISTTAAQPTKSQVDCYYVADTPSPVPSCVRNMPNNPSSSNGTTWPASGNYTKKDCSLATVANTTPAECTKTTNSVSGNTWTGDTVTCSYATTGSKTDVTTGTCPSTEVIGTPVDGTKYTNSDVRCAYNGSKTGPTAKASCTVKLGNTAAPFDILTETKCTKSYNTVGPSAAGSGGCQTVTANPDSDLIVNNAVIRSQVVCSYGSWSGYSNASACSITNQTVDNANDVNGSTGLGTIFVDPAVQCDSTPLVEAQPTCTGSSNSTGQTITCAQGAGFTNWADVVSPATCSPAAYSYNSTTGVYTAGVECKYVFTGSTTGTTCSVSSPTGNDPLNATNFTVLAPVSCSYQTTPTPTYSGTCVATTASTGPTDYTEIVARTCTANTTPDDGNGVNGSTITVDDCTPSIAAGVDVPSISGTQSSTNGYTNTNTKVTCSYQPAASTAGSTSNTRCLAASVHTRDSIAANQHAYTSVACGYASARTAGTDYFVPAASCTTVSTADANNVPTDYDSSGLNVQCKLNVAVNPYPITTPTNGCTPGNSGNPNYVQTTCTTLIDSTVPVQSCPGQLYTNGATWVSQSAASGNNWVGKTCTFNASTSNIAVCTTQSPTAVNGWQTITCTSTGGTTNTLADVAEYYYVSDLRTAALGNCTGSPVGSATVGQTLCGTPDTTFNNVPTSGVDLNPAQHMTTFTLGLGASGYMQYTSKYASSEVQGGSPDYLAVLNGTTAAPSSGTCGWQNAGACNWPVPVKDDQSGIDDLWHAGVNGRGSYFSATDPTTLANSISTALASVNSARGSSTGVATSNPNISVNDNYIFSTTFTTGTWDGQLVRQQINTTTGAVNATPDWLAQAKLDSKSAATRNIYTFDITFANNLKPFTSANLASNAAFITPNISTASIGLSQYLCSSPAICLTTADQTTAMGANLVNYLRGDRTNEGARTDNTKYFRERSHILGDIVNSQSVYVSKPTSSYADAGYSTFAASNSSRLAVVYAGANDGMLHAFRAKGSATAEAAAAAAAINNTPTNVNAAIAAQAADVTAGVDGGQEIWAYIPGTVLPNLYHLADKNYSNNHRYYVDGNQEVADVCISSCGTSSAVWKTILVGGLARGGRAYYALDITDPINPKALWEYTDSNLGYTYGNPQIGKLSNGTWVVLFTSGYNNVPNDDGTSGDGQGRLYVLNAYTGVLINSITTGVGTTSSPSGLSKIAARVVNPIADSTITAVYGGDLLGNLWRFDINDNIGVAGYDAQLLAKLSDSATTSGNPQPITTKPQVGLVDGNVVVYIGTGVYLANSDVDNKNVQSIYAIKDPLSTTGTASTAIYPNPRAAGGFVQQTQTKQDCPIGTPTTICVTGESVRTTVNNPVSFSTNGGWYLDLRPFDTLGQLTAAVGERANTDLVLGFGLLIFNTNTPESKACTLGGSSNQYYLDYRTGGAASSSTTGVIGITLGNQLYSSPAIANVNGQPVAISVGSTGTPKTNPIPPNPTPGDTRRTLWRELINQ